MYPIQVSIASAPSSRNRMTVLIRLLLLIPHAIVAYFFQIVANLAAFAHWVVIVFTGRRNESLQQFIGQYLGYTTAVTGYGALLHDEFPAFGSVPPGAPVMVAVAPFGDAPANRITALFRFVVAIPAYLIATVFQIAAQVVMIVSWFAIVFTGRQPDGMRAFIAKVVTYSTQVQGYGLLLVDDYPWPSATGFDV